MDCKECGGNNFINGTIQGVSFEPCSEHKKRIGTGVYGIDACVCLDCGALANMKIDAKTLQNIILGKKKKLLKGK